ncbi:MAG: hypothetical protein KAU46_10375 [Candidatus Aminicenantes bacterium]|nr:hypothetical protein [Candidatus Aminicenantes bacterium]
MSNPTIGAIQNLFGKKVKFWFTDLDGKYESKGVVTEYIVAENCLTVQDDKDGVKYYVGIDQVEILKEGK